MKKETVRRIAITLVVMLIASFVITLAGCTQDPLAQQYREGSSKNYIAGDGTVTEFAKSERPAFEAWSGETESGLFLKSESLLGSVVVMNWWYAACAPCRAEAPDLAALSREFEDQGVQFVGVNVRDSAETALAFDRRFGITFPSVLDAQSGEVSLAFTGVVSPQAVPTTLVIDKEGKVASRILGRIDASILRTLIESVVSE
ncbi:TlpA disulfide reductase family protein [Aquiluna sp. KACHI24]|uniref:TlpA family protein disulfide reductase n=1 Tax=Aquiluna sp. KACHI24 TaxID=2968831 RepID=UPI0022005685|nr:TlpA disulfide reductase family protein [Aquiluna sp. KACHI24]BDQ00868.1 thiol-disulfide isomerase [Aquiluna sp. KACHI24]